MHRFIISLLLAGVVFFSGHAVASKVKVVFINPGHPHGDSTGAFWSTVNRFMQAAANDLDIELTTLFANRDHLMMKNLATTVGKYSPDYVIIVNEKGVGVDLVRSISRHNIPIFSLLNSFSSDELQQLMDNQKALLIGSLTPNNFIAGKMLATDLLAIHQQKYSNLVPYHFLALQGDYRSPAALERKRGLMTFLASNNNVNLIDMPIGNWSRQQAYLKVKGLLKRQRIDVIWAANDPMAIGAKKAVEEANLSYQVTIGGINWDEKDADYPIDISYGGHVTLGAKALAMLADFHNKQMSRCEMHLKLDIFKSDKQNNLAMFLANTHGENIEQFDFTRFSKQHQNTAVFTLDTFVDKNYKQIANNNVYAPCIELANQSN